MWSGGPKALSRVVLLVGAALPVGLAARFWGFVERHPVAAVMLALGWEAFLAGAAFAGKVFGELQGRWVTRAADGFERWVGQRFSRFERDYRALVEHEHRFTDLKGLATRGEQLPRLREVFVDVSLVPRPLHDVTADGALTAVAGGEGRRSSLQELLRDPEPVVLAVVGAPGTGKTTLLEHTAVRLATGGRKAGPRTLPVLLALRDHAAAVADDPQVSLPERIRCALGALGPREPAGWFEAQLDRGRCVVMLDGLDEVARSEDRQGIVEWVERQIARFPDNDWVITSRPHGYQSAPMNRARVLQVRRFTGEQIERFVHRWYHAVERISTGTDDAGVARLAGRHADDLLERLRGRPMLFDIASNPLILTMIANVHRYRGALPGSRAELYTAIVEVLLWRRQEAKRLSPAAEEPTGVQKEMVLRRLAFTMMEERIRDLPEERAEELLRPALGLVGFAGTARDFLAPVIVSGLMVERELGLCSFAHFTLQEHLAASHIREHGLRGTLARHVTDPWWRETTLLWAARTDPSAVVEACLDDGGVQALGLAFDCFDEAATLQPAVRRRLESIREQALRAPVGSPRWRQMAAITVARELREVVRLADDTLVVSRPVSRGLYGLFETAHPHLPLYGRTDSGARDRAVATGVSAGAARTFVDWVNDLVGGSSTYRLPLPEHLTAPGIQTVLEPGGHCAWTRGTGGGDPVVLWVPEGMDHPFDATRESTERRLRPDDGEVLRAGATATLLALCRALRGRMPATAPLPAPVPDAGRVRAAVRAGLGDPRARSGDVGAHQVSAQLAETADALAACRDLLSFARYLTLCRELAVEDLRLRSLDATPPGAAVRQVRRALADALRDTSRRALELLVARVVALAVDGETVTARIGELEAALDHAHELARPLAFPHDDDPGHDPALLLGLGLALDVVRSLTGTLGERTAAGPAHDLARHPALDGDADTRADGVAALTLRLASVVEPRSVDLIASVRGICADSAARHAFGEPWSYVPDTLHTYLAQLRRVLEEEAPRSEEVSSWWHAALGLTDRMRALAEDPSQWRSECDRTGAVLRCAALVVCAVGRHHGHARVTELARSVAAAVSLLQDRADGTLIPGEALVLLRT